MSEHRSNPATGSMQQIPTESHTHRYGPGDLGQSSHPQGPPPYAPPFGGGQGPGQQAPPGWYGQPPHTPRQPKTGRGSLVTAGILVGALVLGGFGGLVAAAGFSALDDGGAGSSPGITSTVVDRKDTPAQPGSVEGVANSVLPSVVKINVAGAEGRGSGSGIIISSNGEILTNNHVVEVAAGGGEMSVSFNDGTTAPAQVVGTDPLTDLAVIRAQGVSGLTPAKLGESGNLDVGEQVVAIGSPFGLEATVTSGIVSALHRPVSVGDPTANSDTTYPAIQTDAAINPGNSGGPLVNMQGEVVGINSSIRSNSTTGGEGGSIGLGFAIPLDEVRPVVDQLRAGETPTHAQLGVTVTDAASKNGLVTGAGISSVSNGSAAEKAGVENGDVVTKVNGEVISGAESLVATIRGYRPGDTVTLTVVRNGDEQTMKVTLDSDGGSPSS